MTISWGRLIIFTDQAVGSCEIWRHARKRRQPILAKDLAREIEHRMWVRAMKGRRVHARQGMGNWASIPQPLRACHADRLANARARRQDRLEP